MGELYIFQKCWNVHNEIIWNLHISAFKEEDHFTSSIMWFHKYLDEKSHQYFKLQFLTSNLYIIINYKWKVFKIWYVITLCLLWHLACLRDYHKHLCSINCSFNVISEHYRLNGSNIFTHLQLHMFLKLQVVYKIQILLTYFICCAFYIVRTSSPLASYICAGWDVGAGW